MCYVVSDNLWYVRCRWHTLDLCLWLVIRISSSACILSWPISFSEWFMSGVINQLLFLPCSSCRHNYIAMWSWGCTASMSTVWCSASCGLLWTKAISSSGKCVRCCSCIVVTQSVSRIPCCCFHLSLITFSELGHWFMHELGAGWSAIVVGRLFKTVSVVRLSLSVHLMHCWFHCRLLLQH